MSEKGVVLTNPNKRFWETTKGRVVTLLRSGSRTVNEIAAAIEITDNAVRAQLTALERDGLVRKSGVRRGPRKPHTTYALTPESGQLFPKAYGPILRVLFAVLKQRLPPQQVDDIIRAVGRQIAPNFGTLPQGRGGQQSPAEQALLVLHELGGFCDFEAEDSKVILQCGDCPLAIVVAGHPEACKLIESILAEVLGMPVKERCRTAETPRCMFEIAPA